jgi:hypothetical protein
LAYPLLEAGAYPSPRLPRPFFGWGRRSAHALHHAGEVWAERERIAALGHVRVHVVGSIIACAGVSGRGLAQELVDLILELALERANLLHDDAQLDQMVDDGVVADGLACGLEDEVKPDVDDVVEEEVELDLEEGHARRGRQVRAVGGAGIVVAVLRLRRANF